MNSEAAERLEAALLESQAEHELPTPQPLVSRQSSMLHAIPDAEWSAAVAKWLDSHVRGSAAAGLLDWNHIHSVLPALRDCLESELKGRS